MKDKHFFNGYILGIIAALLILYVIFNMLFENEWRVITCQK